MIENLLSVSIMSIPERAAHARKMALLLAPLQPKLVVDIQHKGIWPNAKKAWMPAGMPYHMVLQDDLEFADHFVLHLEPIITLLPDHVISFYQTLGQRQRNYESIQKGWHWMVSQRVSTAQAILMPRHKAIEFLKWEAKNFPQQNETGWHKRFYDDVRIGEWQMETGHLCYCPVPELVRHVGWVSTVVKRRRQPPAIDTFYHNCPDMIDWSLGLHEAEQSVYPCAHNARALSLIQKSRKPKVLNHL